MTDLTPGASAIKLILPVICLKSSLRASPNLLALLLRTFPNCSNLVIDSNLCLRATSSAALS